MKLNINDKTYSVDIKNNDIPLLWILRDYLNLTGTKYSCGIGVCGTCTVLIDGEPRKSCMLKAGDVKNNNITTIEGISSNNDHPVQKAWVKHQVPQCGYCQSGQVLTAVSYLSRNPNISDEEIDRVMSSILCRCGTYPRIKDAIKDAAQLMKNNS